MEVLPWFHHPSSKHMKLTNSSLHGRCNTLQESQKWFNELLTKHNVLFYAVFAKPSNAETSSNKPGELLGNMMLGLSKEPHIQPPPPPCSSSDHFERLFVSLNTCHLSYSFFKFAWGKGYATEAGRALLAAYTASVAKRKKEGKETFYVEAIWGRKNPASGRVLTKLGFQEIGWQLEEEQVFLAGEWQEPGYWVYGMYL
jgi:RimJ/RimL family protein N-acetyltransferase